MDSLNLTVNYVFFLHVWHWFMTLSVSFATNVALCLIHICVALLGVRRTETSHAIFASCGVTTSDI